jgi:hypothetical protein
MNFEAVDKKLNIDFIVPENCLTLLLKFNDLTIYISY